jgi:hypothetical protein
MLEGKDDETAVGVVVRQPCILVEIQFEMVYYNVPDSDSFAFSSSYRIY